MNIHVFFLSSGTLKTLLDMVIEITVLFRLEWPSNSKRVRTSEFYTMKLSKCQSFLDLNPKEDKEKNCM